MIIETFYGFLWVLLLRWVIWGTLRLFKQDEELNQLCGDGLQESQDEARRLSCLLHNGLSEQFTKNVMETLGWNPKTRLTLGAGNCAQAFYFRYAGLMPFSMG